MTKAEGTIVRGGDCSAAVHRGLTATFTALRGRRCADPLSVRELWRRTSGSL